MTWFENMCRQLDEIARRLDARAYSERLWRAVCASTHGVDGAPLLSKRQSVLAAALTHLPLD